MNIFFTADNHFGHSGILKHCQRPFFSIEEHDEKQIKNWNNIIGRRDLIYILGDFAWKNHNKYIGRLNGKKILIIGSHDKMSQDCYKNFTEIHYLLTRKIDEKYIVMCHYAMRSWPKSHYNSLHFYAHSHGRLIEQNLSCDVGVDIWDYKPVPWEILKKKMTDRENNLIRVFKTKEEINNIVKQNRENNLKYLYQL
jgi:calcineurin-like phosphoesterase family protein